MDLNEVPIDPVLSGLKIEEKKVGNLDDVVDMDLASLMNNDVEQICREVLQEFDVLDLEIQNKEMNLEEIRSKIRVLGDEKRGIEEEIKGLKRRKAALQGVEVGGTMDTEVSSNESDELSRVDQLMVENRVLECEKIAAVKEVEVWKQKCKELELLLKLGGKSKCLGGDHDSDSIEDDVALNGDNVGASIKFGSLSSLTGAIDGRLPMEGMPDKEKTEDALINKVHVKKQLTYQTKRCLDKKFAPPTPVEKELPSVSVVDIIDSDNECDTHVSHRPSSQSDINSSMMSESVVPETDGTLSGVNYGEEQSGGKEDAPSILTPRSKRKRDLMVVTSDDECEDLECTPNRRSLKIENSDNDGDDDNLKRRQVTNRVTNDSESDYDDDIPISQLKKKQTHQGSSQPVGTLNPTRPRRRLVKRGHSEQKDNAQDSGNHRETLETENAANDESSEEDSENSGRSLGSFIVEDDEYDEGVEHDEDCEDDEDAEDAVSKGDAGDDPFGLQDTSDDDLDYEEILSKLQSRRHPNSKWISEGDMLSDFGKNPELCLRAVCALYRQQTIEEKACKASLIPNGRGFSKFDATRGTRLGEFLTDGDPNGDLVKSVEELQEHHPDGGKECRRLADHYSKQLFKIYENGEDPFFP